MAKHSAEVQPMEWRADVELLWMFRHPHGKCACGKHATQDQCVVSNRGQVMVVGRECLHPLGTELSKLAQESFTGLEQLIKDTKHAKAPSSLVHFVASRGLIDSKERDFYLQITSKDSKCSAKQAEYFANLNLTMTIALTHPPKLCPSCKRYVPARISVKRNIYYRCCNKWL